VARTRLFKLMRRVGGGGGGSGSEAIIHINVVLAESSIVTFIDCWPTASHAQARARTRTQSRKAGLSAAMAVLSSRRNPSELSCRDAPVCGCAHINERLRTLRVSEKVIDASGDRRAKTPGKNTGQKHRAKTPGKNTGQKHRANLVTSHPDSRQSASSTRTSVSRLITNLHFPKAILCLRKICKPVEAHSATRLRARIVLASRPLSLSLSLSLPSAFVLAVQ
jgi:hypothetical protein